MYPMHSRCLHCTLCDTMACRQTLYTLFFRPQSSLSRRTHHLHDGDSSAADRYRLEAFYRRSTVLGFRPATAPTLSTICSEAVNKLFTAITFNSSNLLHHRLPPKRDIHYSWRPVLTISHFQFELLHRALSDHNILEQNAL